MIPIPKDKELFAVKTVKLSPTSIEMLGGFPDGFMPEGSPIVGLPVPDSLNRSKSIPFSIHGLFSQPEQTRISNDTSDLTVKYIDGGGVSTTVKIDGFNSIAKIALKYPGDDNYRKCLFTWDSENNLEFFAIDDWPITSDVHNVGVGAKCIPLDGGDGYLYFVFITRINGTDNRILVVRYSQESGASLSYEKYAYSALFSTLGIDNPGTDAVPFDAKFLDGSIFVTVGIKSPANIHLFRLTVTDYNLDNQQYGDIGLIASKIYSFSSKETLDGTISIGVLRDFINIMAGVNRSESVDASAVNYVITTSSRDIRSWSSSVAYGARGGIAFGYNTPYATTDSTIKLNGQHILDDGFGVTVGDKGVILNTTDFGKSWTDAASDHFAVRNKFDLFCCRIVRSSTSDGKAYIIYVGGANGLLMRSTDSGVTWKVIVAPGNSGLSVKIENSAFSFTVASSQTFKSDDFEVDLKLQANNYGIYIDIGSDSIYFMDSISSSQDFGSTSTVWFATRRKIFFIQTAENSAAFNRTASLRLLVSFYQFDATLHFETNLTSQETLITCMHVLDDSFDSPQLIVGGNFWRRWSSYHESVQEFFRLSESYTTSPLLCRITNATTPKNLDETGIDSMHPDRAAITYDDMVGRGLYFSVDKISDLRAIEAQKDAFTVGVIPERQYDKLAPVAVTVVHKHLAYCITGFGTILKWQPDQTLEADGATVVRDATSFIQSPNSQSNANQQYLDIDVARDRAIPYSDITSGVNAMYVLSTDKIYVSYDNGNTWNSFKLDNVLSFLSISNTQTRIAGNLIEGIYSVSKNLNITTLLSNNKIVILNTVNRTDPILKSDTDQRNLYVLIKNLSSKKLELWTSSEDWINDDTGTLSFSYVSSPGVIEKDDLVALTIIDNNSIVVHINGSGAVSLDSGGTWNDLIAVSTKPTSPLINFPTDTSFQVVQYNNSRLIACMRTAADGDKFRVVSSRKWVSESYNTNLPVYMGYSPTVSDVWTGIGDVHIKPVGIGFSDDLYTVPVEFLFKRGNLIEDTPSQYWATSRDDLALGRTLDLFYDRQDSEAVDLLGGPGLWNCDSFGVIGCSFPWIEFALTIPGYNTPDFPGDVSQFTTFKLTSVVKEGAIDASQIKDGCIIDISANFSNNQFSNSSIKYYLMVSKTGSIDDYENVEIRPIVGNSSKVIFNGGSAITGASGMVQYAIFSDRMFSDGSVGFRGSDYNYPVPDITNTEYEVGRILRVRIPKIYPTEDYRSKIGYVFAGRKAPSILSSGDDSISFGAEAKWSSTVIFTDEVTPSGIRLSKTTSRPKMVFELPYTAVDQEQALHLHDLLAPDLQQTFIFIPDRSDLGRFFLVFARDGFSVQGAGGNNLSYSLVLEEQL